MFARNIPDKAPHECEVIIVRLKPEKIFPAASVRLRATLTRQAANGEPTVRVNNTAVQISAQRTGRWDLPTWIIEMIIRIYALPATDVLEDSYERQRRASLALWSTAKRFSLKLNICSSK